MEGALKDLAKRDQEKQMDRHTLEREGQIPNGTQLGGDPAVPLPDPERPKTVPTSPPPTPPEEEPS